MTSGNRLGTISLVLGLAGVATSVVLVGAAVGAAGCVCGVLALVRVHRGEATNMRAATAGMVLSTLAVLATVGLVLQAGSARS